MTLKKDDIKKLSEQTRIPVKDLTNAIKAEEETPLEFTENLQNFTDDELETRDKEMAKKAGKTAIEIAVKEARNEQELEFEGKTVPNLVKAIYEKGKKEGLAEAGKKPNETIEEQKQQIETLRTNLEKIEQEKNTEIENLKADKQKIQDNISVSSSIPSDLDTVFTNRDLTNLFNVEHTSRTDEDNVKTWYRDGKPLLDSKTQKPIELKTVMADWLDNKGIKTKTDARGRGAGDDKGKKADDGLTKIKTSDDFYNYLKENEIPDSKRKEVLAKVQKDNPEFVLGES